MLDIATLKISYLFLLSEHADRLWRDFFLFVTLIKKKKKKIEHERLKKNCYLESPEDVSITFIYRHPEHSAPTPVLVEQGS